MKPLNVLFSILLALSATVAFAQGRPAHHNRGDFGSFMKEIYIWEKLGEQAREEEDLVRIHPQAQLVPNGWLDDFDYQSSLAQYLDERMQQAIQSGKDIYLYLYADWLDTCQEFRKTIVSREDYAELFEGHEIVMLDYGYFAKTFDVKLKNLPVLIQVHGKTGMIGPELLHPLPTRAEHPAKAFQRVKTFLGAGG